MDLSAWLVTGFPESYHFSFFWHCNETRNFSFAFRLFYWQGEMSSLSGINKHNCFTRLFGVNWYKFSDPALTFIIKTVSPVIPSILFFQVQRWVTILQRFGCLFSFIFPWSCRGMSFNSLSFSFHFFSRFRHYSIKCVLCKFKNSLLNLFPQRLPKFTRTCLL